MSRTTTSLAALAAVAALGLLTMINTGPHQAIYPLHLPLETMQVVTRTELKTSVRLVLAVR